VNADQAAALRSRAAESRAVERASRSALRLTVTSGKGGVGKSNFALNAAIALAALDRRVLLVDADANLANLDLLIGVNPKHNLGDVFRGRAGLNDVLIDGPGGLKILPGASGDLELLDHDAEIEQRLSEGFRTLDRSFDVILIDTGAGLSPEIVSYAAAADDTVIVTHAEPTATADAYAMIKVISQRNPNARIHILVNMVRSQTEAEDLFDRLSLVVQNFLQFPLEFLGFIPNDPQVRIAVAAQRPFSVLFPNSPAAIAVRMMVRKLLRMPWTGGTPERESLWSRVFGGRTQ